MTNREYKTKWQADKRDRDRILELKGLITQLNVFQAENKKKYMDFIKEQNEGYKNIEKKLNKILSQIK